MKKQGLRKIIASVSLSLCVALSAGIALTGINNDYASASGSITGENYAASVTSDASGTQSTFVLNEKQARTDATFTGLKLKAVAGATYNLGAVDIAGSNWAGTYTATAAGNNNSMLEFVVNYDNSNGADGIANENVTVEFTFSQGDESMTIKVRNYAGDNSHDLAYNAKAYNQSVYGAFRTASKNVDAHVFETAYCRKMIVNADDAEKMGWTKEEKHLDAIGGATAPNAFYYDFDTKALYSPSTFVSKGLKEAYLIRDFDSTESAYNGGGAIWNGFTKTGDKCMVNVSVKFVQAGKPYNVIITKLGDITIGETINVTNDNLIANYHIVPQVVADNDPNTNNEIKLPKTDGERTVTITNVYTGEFVKYKPSEIVENKITFNPTVAGAYTLELNVGDYYLKTDVVNAVEDVFKKDKASIAQGVVAKGEGASATVGSATSAQGEYSGIVLEGGAGAKFTINDVDVSNLYYNNMNDFASLFSMAIAPRASTKAYILFDDINGDGKYDYSDLDVDGDNILDQDEIITDPTGASIDFVPNLDEDITTISNEELEFKNEVIAKIIKYSKDKSDYDKKDVKYVHGEAIQASELSYINIYLTDVEDPNKVITVKLQCANYGDEQTTASTGAKVDAETEQSFNCYRYAKDKEPLAAPYVSSTPKNDIFTGRTVNGLTLIYDNSKVATYTNADFVHVDTYKTTDGKLNADNCTLLRDYNDYRGGAVMFDGFTSGKVNVTIEFGDLFENGYSAMSYHSTYSGVDTAKFVNYNKETEITSTKVVLTNFLGLDLSADNLEYSIFDAYYKTIDDVVAFHNEEFALPYNKLIHPYLGVIDATARYEILDSEGNLVSNELKGEYGSDIKATLPKGKYTLRVTDMYNNTFNLPIGVYPRVKFDVGANVNAYVGEDLIIDDDIVDIFGDFDLSLMVNDGYELYSVYLNGEQLTLNEIINIDYSKLTGADVIKLRAKVTDYKITYKYAETDTVIEETTFNMDMIKDGVKLEAGPSVTGKRFLGWFENDVKFEDFESIGLRDIVVYAIYGEPQFNVTFDLGDETYVQVVEEGGKALSYIPTKEGFVFDGWVKEDGSAYDFNTTLTTDVKLIAKWKELSSIGVEDAEKVDSVIEAEDGKISNVNAIQIICYALLGLGVAGVIAVIVIAILKKKASNKGEEVDEEI